jgi:hypothetical protein
VHAGRGRRSVGRGAGVGVSDAAPHDDPAGHAHSTVPVARWLLGSLAALAVASLLQQAPLLTPPMQPCQLQ